MTDGKTCGNCFKFSPIGETAGTCSVDNGVKYDNQIGCTFHAPKGGKK